VVGILLADVVDGLLCTLHRVQALAILAAMAARLSIVPA